MVNAVYKFIKRINDSPKVIQSTLKYQIFIYFLYVCYGIFHHIQFNQWCRLAYLTGHTVLVVPDKCVRREGGGCCRTELCDSEFLNGKVNVVSRKHTDTYLWIFLAIAQ